MKTIGIHPKIPAQAVGSLAAAALAYFALALSPELSALIAAVAGSIAAYFAPAASVELAGTTLVQKAKEAGQAGINLLIQVLVLVIVVVLVVYVIKALV